MAEIQYVAGIISNWKDVPVGPQGYPNYSKFAFKTWPPKGHACGWREAYAAHMSRLPCRNSAGTAVPKTSTDDEKFVEDVFAATKDEAILKMVIAKYPARPTTIRNLVGANDLDSITLTVDDMIAKIAKYVMREGGTLTTKDGKITIAY
jgi:hypothetical protein